MNGRVGKVKLSGADVLVLGAGVSGRAAALLLNHHGSRVTLADEADEEQVRRRLSDAATAISSIVAGGCPLPPSRFDLCVTSPAFPPGHPWLAECRQRGVEIISELQLGADYCSAQILAVTGSKGKSSVVKLCAETLCIHGISASPAGNYGIPLCELALQNKDTEWAVTEVSSFQMENTEDFSPRIAVLLNVQPDHLDRHASMQEYKSLKLKMFSRMKPGSLALVHEDVALDSPLPDGVRLLRFGVARRSEWRWNEGVISGVSDSRDVSVNIGGCWFDNPVFGVSAAAAAAALLEAGLTCGDVERGLREFVPLKHRMERFFVSPKGVAFIDDSKATSLAAMAAAVKMIKTPVYLIAGGLLKEKLDENTKELLTRGVKKVYLIGDCCEQMFDAWSDDVPCVKCGTLERAVRDVVDDAGAGETVVLSPGTASFDQFRNYGERGDMFKDFVREVAGGYVLCRS